MQQPDWSLKLDNKESMSRTICLKLTGKYFDVHDLYKFFNKHGEVKSVRIDWLPHDQKIGFVEFAEARPANEILSKCDITIENNSIEISLLNANYPQLNGPRIGIADNVGAEARPTNEILSKCDLTIENEIALLNKNVGAVTKLFKKIWTFMGVSWKRLKKCKCPTLLRSSDSELSKNSLNVLNDDCLYEIFQNLNLLSITNVANACVRFNEIAKQVFKMKYGKRKISLYLLIENNVITLSDLKNFFRNFGSSIQSLKLDSYNNNSIPLLCMINEHCEILNELKIDYYLPIDGRQLNVINSLLSRLKKLKIEVWHSNGAIEDLIAACYQLESLQIKHICEKTKPISLQKFILPNLVELRLMCKIDGLSLEGFLRRNSQLKKLEIETYSLINIDSIFKLIGYELPNLQELIFLYNQRRSQDFNAGIKYLSCLKDMKVFKIDFQFVNILPLMQSFSLNNKSIECLGLQFARIDDIGIDVIICRMKSINRIELKFVHTVINGDHLIRLVENLPNLKTLHIDSVYDVTSTVIKTMLKHANHLSELKMELENIQNFHFNAIDYNDVVEIVKKRITRIKLYIEFSSNMSTNLVCLNIEKLIVFNMHSDWVTVEKNYDYCN